MTQHLPNGAPIAAIPEALRQRERWVLWREEEVKPGKWTKVPYTYTRKKAHLPSKD
jgi:primase-polymerase (primpol)-like protein